MFKRKLWIACVAAAAMLSQAGLAGADSRKNARLTDSLRADYSTKARASRVGNDIVIRCNYRVSVEKKIVGGWFDVAKRSDSMSATVPDNSHQLVYDRQLGHGVSVEVWVTAGGGDVTVTYVVRSPRGVYENQDRLHP